MYSGLSIQGDPYGHPIQEVASLRVFGPMTRQAYHWNGTSRVNPHVDKQAEIEKGIFLCFRGVIKVL